MSSLARSGQPGFTRHAFPSLTTATARVAYSWQDGVGPVHGFPGAFRYENVKLWRRGGPSAVGGAIMMHLTLPVPVFIC